MNMYIFIWWYDIWIYEYIWNENQVEPSEDRIAFGRRRETDVQKEERKRAEDNRAINKLVVTFLGHQAPSLIWSKSKEPG